METRTAVPLFNYGYPMVPSGRGTTLRLQSDRRRAVIVPRRRCPNAETRVGVDRTARRWPRKPTWLRLAD